MRVLISKPVDSVIHMDIFDKHLQSRVMSHSSYVPPRYLANFTKCDDSGVAIFKTSKLYIGKRGFERAWRWAYRSLITN
jgi:hypothetical protein